MFCSNCGTQISDGAKFCHNCGAPVVSNTAPAQASEPVTAPESSIPASPFQVPVPEQPAAADASVNGTEIPVPSFAVPAVTPGDIVLPEPPVFEMPGSVTAPVSHSVYTDPSAALMPEVSAHPDAQTFTGSEYDQRPQPAAAVPQTEPQPLYRQAEPEAPAQPQAAPQSIYQQVTQTSSQQSSFTGAPFSAAQNASGQTSVPVPPASPAVPVKKEKKKSSPVKAVIIFAVLALIAAGWWFFFGPGNKEKTPVIEVPEDIEEYVLGVEAYNDGDYAAAEEYLEKAWELLPDSSEIGYYLYETYRQYTIQLLDSHDYINAEPRLNKLLSLSDLDPDDYWPTFYRQWIMEIVMGTAEGDLKDIAERVPQYLTQDLIDIIDNYDPDNPVPANKTYDDIALMIARAVDEDDWLTACGSLYASDNVIRNAIEDSQYGYVTANVVGFDYEYVRFYYNADEDIVYAYYGDLNEDGERSGVGFLVSTRYYDGEPYLYYFLSMWSEDKPNGRFKEIVRRGSDFSDVETYDGYTVYGTYDGDVEWVRGGTTFLCTYDNGVPQVIRIDENGCYVIAQATDGSDRYLYLDEEPDPDDHVGLELWD